MFSAYNRTRMLIKNFSTSSKKKKIAVLGAAGGIGQPLSLLLSKNPLISHLSLYDIANTKGIGCDLSHINTKTIISSHTGIDELETCLKNSDIVVIPAGVPRKPGMSRDDLFNTNARIVRDLAVACSKYCPEAIVAVISNPVNSTVPIVSRIYKEAGVHNPKKIFGVCTLDVIRANKFVAELKGLDPTIINVPVIGGHSGITILPLLSQIRPKIELSNEEIKTLTVRIQNAGTEVVEAKNGTGSATLSMAFAGFRFIDSLLRSMNEDHVIECAFVESNACDSKFFSSPIVLGSEGVKENLGISHLSNYEKGQLQSLLPELRKNIERGESFI